MYPWVGVSMAQNHGVSLLPTGLTTLGQPARPAAPPPPGPAPAEQGGVGSALRPSMPSAVLSYHPSRPPQQLPDLPPHLPPA